MPGGLDILCSLDSDAFGLEVNGSPDDIFSIVPVFDEDCDEELVVGGNLVVILQAETAAETCSHEVSRFSYFVLRY